MHEEKVGADKATAQVKATTDQIRTVAQESAQTVKAKAGEVLTQAEKRAGALADQVKESAGETTAEVHAKAESAFDEQKQRAISQAEGITSALRQSSQELRSNDQEDFAHYADMAANQVEHFTGYIRSKGLDDVLQDVQTLARRQPELFVAGMLAGGFLLGRFLKSSQKSQRQMGNRFNSAGDRAHVAYYADNYRSPYPSGDFPSSYRPAADQRQYDTMRNTATTQPEPHFSGGATEFNGQRSMHGAFHNSYGNDPAVTGADWGVDYQANEFGQSTPTETVGENKKSTKAVQSEEGKNGN